VSIPLALSAQVLQGDTAAIITGTVRSSQGQALQAANVRIAALNISVGTNANGYYRINVMRSRVQGQFVELAVRAIGYTPKSQTITLGPGVQTHDFTLTGDSTRGSEVVVYYPKINEARRDSAKQLVYTVQRGDTARNSGWIPATGSPFSQHLIPPELIMQNQGRLRITEAQRTAIMKEINKVQETATQAQWRVADESEKLNDLLARDNAPEADVIAQAERLMNWESAVKRAQLTMLIRIRNVLTQDQLTMLREMRRRE
jgi:hypothetical protein